MRLEIIVSSSLCVEVLPLTNVENDRGELFMDNLSSHRR